MRTRQRLEVATQAVDDVVSCLVRHGLGLITATPQHQGRGFSLDGVGEMTDQRTLADPGDAMHVERDCLTEPHGAEGVAELSDLRVAPDEGRRAPGFVR